MPTIAEQLHAEGLAQGKLEGKAEGKAEALHAILAARSFHVPDTLEQRIRACTDPDILQLWLVRAATASTVEDVFNGS